MNDTELRKAAHELLEQAQNLRDEGRFTDGAISPWMVALSRALEQDDGTPTRDEIVKVGLAMKQYGGGFVQALGEAVLRADNEYVRRIKQAFPALWLEYRAIKTFTGENK